MPPTFPTPLRRRTARVARAVAAILGLGALVGAPPTLRAQPATPSAAPNGPPTTADLDSAAARLRRGAAPPTDPPRAVELPAGGAVVPLAAAGFRPIVEGMVDGRGPYRFVIESGAPFSTVSPRIAAAAGLVPADTADPVVTVGTIAVGPARLRDFRMLVLADPLPGVDGVIGLNAYRDLLLTLDYPRRAVRLARGTLAPANGRDRLALLPAAALWEVEIELAGRRARAVLDTQGAGAFNGTPEVARGVPFTSAPVAVGTVQGPGIGTQPQHAARVAGDVRVGDVLFERPIVGIVPAPPGYPAHWNLGGPALAEFTVTIDQRARVLELARPGRAPVAAPPPLHLAGFRAPPRGGRRVVLEVTPNGEAARRGVRVGDEIVRVDGRPATALSVDAWRARVLQAGPLPLRLRAPDGAQRDVVLHPPVAVP